MKAIIHVELKSGVLDPQGKAVGETLGRMGYEEVQDVRIGKVITLDLKPSEDETTAKSRITEMCERLLANTVIEAYRFEVLAE